MPEVTDKSLGGDVVKVFNNIIINFISLFFLDLFRD